MKKLLKKTIIYAGLLLASYRLMAQEASSEQVVISEPPLSSPLIYDTLKKDNEAIQQLKSQKQDEDEIARRQKIDYTKAAFNFISLYDDKTSVSREDILKNKSRSLLEVFQETLEENLNENLGYYSFREYHEDEFPYPGVFLASIGDTARKKYEIVRKVDKTIKVVQDYVTVKAKVGKETKIKARPTFDDVEENRIGIKADIDNFLYFDRVTIKANDKIIRSGTILPFSRKKYPIYLEVGYDFESYEKKATLYFEKRL
jgi:hypothetical protein